MSIYIVSHKEYDFPNFEGYAPIQVGSVFNTSYLSDSTGDNIADKNKNYCELTALYWIWKNSSEDTIGLNHYRRYFSSVSNDINFKGTSLAYTNELEGILTVHDIVIPNILKLNVPIYVNYGKKHYFNDWLVVGDIIKGVYPEYLETYIKVSKERYFLPTNMFYGKKELMDKYCQWLFSILFEAEKRIDISGYDAYQARIFGFLSERLFLVWIKHNNLNYKEVEVTNVENQEPPRKKKLSQRLNLYKKARVKVMNLYHRIRFTLKYGF